MTKQLKPIEILVTITSDTRAGYTTRAEGARKPGIDRIEMNLTFSAFEGDESW
jgi:hypothetical protein